MRHAYVILSKAKDPVNVIVCTGSFGLKGFRTEKRTTEKGLDLNAELLYNSIVSMRQY